MKLKHKVTYNLVLGMRFGKREKEIIWYLNQYNGLFSARLYKIAGLQDTDRIEKQVQDELWNEQYHMCHDEWNKLVQKEAQKRVQRQYIYYFTSLKSLVRKGLVWRSKEKWFIHRSLEERVTEGPGGTNTTLLKEKEVIVYSLSELGRKVAEKLEVKKHA